MAPGAQRRARGRGASRALNFLEAAAEEEEHPAFVPVRRRVLVGLWACQ